MNFLQIVDSRPLSPHREKCMRSLRDKIGANKYEVLEIPFTTQYEVIAEADRIRLSRAAEDPELCYVDTDCFISIPLCSQPIEMGVPYFGTRAFNGINHPDIFYFYVNRNCDYFRMYLNESLIQKNVYGVPAKNLEELSEFRYISDLTYYHQSTTMEQLALEKKAEALQADLSKTTLKLAALRKHIELMAITLNG